MNSYNVFVTGTFNAGKTTLLKFSGGWDGMDIINVTTHFSVDVGADHTLLRVRLDTFDPPVCLFDHGGAIYGGYYWERIGAQFKGMLLIVDLPMIYDERYGLAVLDTTIESLEYYREHAAGRFIIAANKIDYFKGWYREALTSCRHALGIRPDEVLIPSVATNPASVRYTIARLIRYLERNK